ncbi:lef-9 [Venturia canescens]|uniref:Lef-9 n=1 Tax=Venturia canescens TaxID=32260 RepID=A0ACB9ZKR5_9HYME|nr:uncharacterized LOC122410065 [Venturia canescens]KAI5630617.1 lef-9 [Venturia canescens]
MDNNGNPASDFKASDGNIGEVAKPLFLTHKIRIDRLSKRYNVHDFQLRDHLLTAQDIYTSRCKCVHTHNKKRCPFVTVAFCEKCQVANRRFINYRSLLFHRDIQHCHLYECCVHIHEPPCNRCLGCKTRHTCLVQQPFECTFTTHAVCTKHDPARFTKPTASSEFLYEHMYNTRMPIFYFCQCHKHEHISISPTTMLELGAPCYIQTYKCCDKALLVTEFDSSFILTTTKLISLNSGTMAQRLVNAEYVIFDPSIWREQSVNHFISLLRAFVSMPELVLERYKRFESSNFVVSNVKAYRSGKLSIIRTSITGFETKGIYQTSTISCTLHYSEVLIPRKIYELMRFDYDLNLVAVKRDPSIKQTCTFVCRAIENPDPEVDTIVIPDAIAKPLNQDQDGDKNGVYVLPIVTANGYHRAESFLHKLAKLELAMAFRRKLTLIATPRYSFSENNLMLMRRKASELSQCSEFFRTTAQYGTKFMLEVGCAYMEREYDEFCRLLLKMNDSDEREVVTVDDIALLTDKLPAVVQSGAKGDKETLVTLFDNICNDFTLFDKKRAMIDQMNRYISSSKDLSQIGRKQFISLYATHDLVALLGTLFLNKVFIADYKPFASAGTFMFNQASLDMFIADLERL